jgi:hypothetical protein
LTGIRLGTPPAERQFRAILVQNDASESLRPHLSVTRLAYRNVQPGGHPVQPVTGVYVESVHSIALCCPMPALRIAAVWPKVGQPTHGAAQFRAW